MQKSVVSDVNGTFYRPVDEQRTHVRILTNYKRLLINRSKHLSPSAVIGLVRLLKTKCLLEEKYREVKDGRAEMGDLFRLFNERVVDGLPLEFIHASIREMAREASKDIDIRVLNPINAVKKEGAKTGILSAAYGYAIESILGFTEYRDTFPSENIFGDRIVLNSNGTAKGFELRTYGKKAFFLENEFARKRGFRSIIYFGDSEDDLPILPHQNITRLYQKMKPTL
ncbi:MAG: haloacid dehalogenase-like hydrolase [Candidatus Micrarchaeota archaeon]|nr:haloacid dehalogenase-like hydrolase [Candidatus Micrarchaeota archaeon]